VCLSRDKVTVPTDRRAPKWWLGRDDGDPIPFAHCAIRKWEHPIHGGKTRSASTRESGQAWLVFRLVGSGFGGRIGTASIDIVRHGRRRVANVERPGAIFGNAIADCHALVLSQMVGPGFDDERFDVTARVGRIRIQTLSAVRRRADVAPARAA
jgi:hypothetical protein